MKILIVTTNTNHMADEQTGVWMEEFAVPYFAFKEAGHQITVASPLGGVSPLAEESLLCENPTEWDASKPILDNTEKLDDIDYKEYDAIFLPGGHGPMFDLPDNKKLAEILNYFYENHKLITAICHGPAGFVNAKTDRNTPIVCSVQLTSFTNKEEKLAEKEKLVPFMLESKLRHLGAIFIEGEPWAENVVKDGKFITGQNPQSAKLFAETVLKALKH